MIENIEYWVKFSFSKMRKDKTTMPTIIPQILKMEEFKNSGVTEDDLRESIKERFLRERKEILEKAREKLKNLRNTE